MDQCEILMERLKRLFPSQECAGPSAPHDCLECSEIRAQLDGRGWLEVPGSYVLEHEDILPLLSPGARHAFLPAWLCQSLLHPESPLAQMVLVHLSSAGPTEHFTQKQRELVVALAQWVAEHSGFGFDPEDQDTLVGIRRLWASGAA